MNAPTDIIAVRLDVSMDMSMPVVTMTRAQYEALCARIDKDGSVDFADTPIDEVDVLDDICLYITDAEEVPSKKVTP